MAKDFKYYGGSNQIAYLPYKTIDTLQRVGLFLTEGEDLTELIINSETQDQSPDLSVYLGLNVQNYSVHTDQLTVADTLTVKDASGQINDIFGIFTQIINTNYNLSGNEAKLPKEILDLIKGIKKPYIMTGVEQSIILMTDPSFLHGLYIKANGKIMNWVSINAITGGITISSEEKETQYVHMMKIVSTAGDTCYITAVSPMSKRATQSYLTVKLYIIGGLTTAEGTSIGNVTGEYACSGYNSTTNKTIVALDLGENKFVYSDGTKSTEALSSSNTTVTAEVYGQHNN